MTKVRVTRIVCMVCKGDRVKFGSSCYICDDAGKVPVARALDAAQRRYRLAKGGLTSGDYAANTARRLMDEAEQIFAIAGVTPPWKQGSTA
ncbi:hypothetical protein [Mycoplana rhizolycopersici]|uniref:Uncharacterized protein n=1 Tax=Mycoplana rhizolycopersici TaxID=2746702 RepID=A0ABX2QCR5_9HYPH|nr:hypothetical protein [Rhizobium rhizolycopersici]NVP54483.1 hypothetical protein [Rhizobium rhizolycopersici]